MASCDQMLSVNVSQLLKINKHEKYQICDMDRVIHREITLILFGRPAIQLVCLFAVYLFVPFRMMAQNFLYLRNVSVT